MEVNSSLGAEDRPRVIVPDLNLIKSGISIEEIQLLDLILSADNHLVPLGWSWL